MSSKRYRVYCFENLGTNANPTKTEIAVSSPLEAAVSIKALANYQLQKPEIVTNVFGLEVWDDEEGDWVDWTNNEGENIDEVSESLLQQVEETNSTIDRVEPEPKVEVEDSDYGYCFDIKLTLSQPVFRRAEKEFPVARYVEDHIKLPKGVSIINYGSLCDKQIFFSFETSGIPEESVVDDCAEILKKEVLEAVRYEIDRADRKSG